MERAAIDEGLKSLRARARLATFMIYVFIVFSVVRAAVLVADFFGAITLKALPSQTYVDAFYFVIYGSLTAFYGSALVIAFWIYRAHKNLFEAGYDGLEFTPGWSIGWFFVPFANLYMPYKAMREAWHVSLGEGSGLSGPSPPLLVLWWSSYLAGNIVDLLVIVVPSFDVLSRIAMIVAAWALSRIIARITAGQDVVARYAETFA